MVSLCFMTFDETYRSTKVVFVGIHDILTSESRKKHSELDSDDIRLVLRIGKKNWIVRKVQLSIFYLDVDITCDNPHRLLPFNSWVTRLLDGTTRSRMALSLGRVIF